MLYIFSYHASKQLSCLPISAPSHNYGKNFPHFHKISCLDSRTRKIKAPGTTEGSGISACQLNRVRFFFLTSQPNAIRETSEVLKPIK